MILWSDLSFPCLADRHFTLLFSPLTVFAPPLPMSPIVRSSNLGRKPAQRKELIRNLITSLILYESIRTTQARAKAIAPLLDRIITRAKTETRPLAVRSMNRVVTDKNASRKMFEVLVPRFLRRTSGFTRIQPLGRRIGDGAKLVEISLVSDERTPNTPPADKKRESKAAK